MFHDFDPASRDQVFVRRNKRAFILALFAHVAVIGVWAWRDGLRERDVAVLLEPEIKDFALDEQPEPELEDEPPPPPPPDLPQPKPQAPKPRPKPKLEPPKEIPKGPPPEQAAPAADKNFGTGSTGSTGFAKPKPEASNKPEPPQPPPPKPKPPEEKIDPEKPVDRPEGATAPVPDKANKTPDYPSELRDEGIEGEVVLKLHVYRDGTVKGAKILRVTSTATGDEARTRAEKLFKAAVIAAIRTWKFTPSKYRGDTITIWLMQTIPFKLTGGG